MKRPIILTIIILLISFLLGYFVLLEKYNELTSLRFQISQKENELKAVEESFSKLSLIEEELKKHESEISKISLAIPSEPDIPSVANFIQKIAEENKLIIESFDFGETGTFRSSRTSSAISVQAIEESSSLKETNFSLSVLGAYSDFKNFLSGLEKSIRLIDVNILSFSGEASTTMGPVYLPEGSFVFGLELKVYSY